MRFAFSILFCVLCLASSHPFAADGIAPWPNPARFQSGDLLWPNKPGGFVPYSDRGEPQPERAEKAWLNDRDDFVSKAQKGETHLSKAQIDSLKNMSFAEFYNRYAGDREIGGTELYSNSNAFTFVGHAAIVDVDDGGKIWIIEASLDRGVARKPYSEWLKPLSDSLIWHGRVRDVPQPARRGIAEEARKYVGRPYDFWNFDLDDDKGFYCSKLVWLSIFRAIKIAIDGNASPKRQFWFSPKQLLNSPQIIKLHNPSNYSMP